MTDDDENTTTVVQNVTNHTEMDARQVTVHNWTVTSTRNDTQTVHHVNLLERSCTCEDYQFADEDNYACDHILLANHRARRQIDVGEALNFDLLERVKDMEQHIEVIERRSLDAAATQVEHTEAEESADDDGGSDDSGNPLAGFDDLSEGPEALQTLIENEFGSDPPIVCKELDDGWEIAPYLSEMSDSMLDDFDEWTGPDGSDFVSPIWPDDYEDGDPPDGQKVTNEDLGKAAQLL
jgi:SWIM zinc finger.